MLEQRVLALHGERSEYFDPNANSGDPLDPATNLASDTYFTELRQSETVQKLVAQPAPLGPTAQTRQLVGGYAAGFNSYLARTGVALDLWTDIYDIQQFGGIAQIKQLVATATPPAANSPKSSVAPRLPSISKDAFGSNGWGTRSRSTMSTRRTCAG